MAGDGMPFTKEKRGASNSDQGTFVAVDVADAGQTPLRGKVASLPR
jgi:hypothetical protein